MSESVHPRDAAQAEPWLPHFPVPFFAVVLGLGGLTLALRAAETALGRGAVLSGAALWLTLAVFVTIAAIYIAKAIRHPVAVAHEWHHPVRVAFFPAISISVLLVATGLLVPAPELARMLWLMGMLAQGALSVAVVAVWVSARGFQQAHLTPAWFIPAVGNVIVPIAGAELGYIEISWYFLSIGLVFWIVLLTLVMNRLIFHDPMPGKLQPTLVILIAPPAVGFVAWVHLTGDIDAFARILLNAAYFFTLIVAVNLPRIARLPFALSFWALSFPFAAVTIASFLFADRTGSGVHLVFGGIGMAVLVTVIATLAVRTIRAIRAGEICVPE